MNGGVWGPVIADRDDPRPIDRTGTSRLATTDPSTTCVYLSNGPRGLGLEAVSTHGVGHCAMYGYGLLDSPHAVIPGDTWVDVEEWVCNYLANRGREAIHAADTALGRNVPVIK